MTQENPPALEKPPLRDRIRRFVPILVWLPMYQREWLKPDLIAGLTVWGTMVPVSMAYAKLAGLPPEYGLYTAFIAMLAYAIFGTSKHLKVSASSTMAVTSAALVGTLAVINTPNFATLTAALALIVGTMLILAGIFRLGFISDFLSKPVVTGFIFGVAITILVGQIPKLLGIPSSGNGNVFEQLQYIIRHLSESNLYTLALGLFSIVLILILKRFYPKFPASLVALVVGILLVNIFSLEAYGVSIVGEIPSGMPQIVFPKIGLTNLIYLMTGAFGIFFLAVGESLGGAQAYASKNRYEINPDQELIALGAANLGAGLLQGFTVDASMSSTATSDEAGGRTQLSTIFTSLMILLTILFLAPLFQDLPNTVLAAIVITSVLGMMNIKELKRFYYERRTDFWIAIVALVGILFTGVLNGLIIAVFLSIFMVIFSASRPYLAVLGKVPGQESAYGNIARHPENVEIPNLLIIRIDAPLFFANSNTARSQIRAFISTSGRPLSSLLLSLGASSTLDITSMDMLRDLLRDLDDMNIQLLLAEVHGPVRDKLRVSGLMTRIGEEHIYPHVHFGVEDFLQRQSSQDAPSTGS